ncbi:FAD-dependent oxidoreductase [Marinobacterium lutimaris]|uniref:2-polyprenyl-6-methoxyphenol hydroxylase n=1 Tax=Marinobacterium lutimaris TaxID=568106 RepID=A0A1H6AK14_9GAMM|nr:FAD-dependent oxidoreductase [Marinobacterium lutimaris]SEG49093.1 2-polyprenyl-6-methoxyphenol hydroxylase [Marinobacterium lutimaris]
MAAGLNKVLVIGGGFSGMSAAISFRKAGVEVDLVEIDEKWRPEGAGISINGPSLRALDELGVYEQFKEHGYVSENFDVFAATGEFVVQLPTRPPVHERELPGGGGILRPALAKILADKCLEVGTNVRLGLSYSEITQTGRGARVQFTDGSEGDYDLVVAADGVHSSVRKTYFPDAPQPKPIHQSVWRAVLPRPADVVRPRMWMGRTKVGVNPISETQMYMFLTEDRAIDDRVEPEKQTEVLAALVREFPAPMLQELANELDKPDANVDYRPLANLLVPLPWHTGRIVMIGDAAHATTPHLASGAGIGIESAMVLAEELDKSADIETGLKAFEARRWERCRMVIENSAALCEIEKSGGSRDEHASIMRESMATLAQPI